MAEEYKITIPDESKPDSLKNIDFKIETFWINYKNGKADKNLRLLINYNHEKIAYSTKIKMLKSLTSKKDEFLFNCQENFNYIPWKRIEAYHKYKLLLETNILEYITSDKSPFSIETFEQFKTSRFPRQNINSNNFKEVHPIFSKNILNFNEIKKEEMNYTITLHNNPREDKYFFIQFDLLNRGLLQSLLFNLDSLLNSDKNLEEVEIILQRLIKKIFSFDLYQKLNNVFDVLFFQLKQPHLELEIFDALLKQQKDNYRFNIKTEFK